MLFAAGFGTRMKHLTKDQPKPMIPVAGRPLIDHAVHLATSAGIPRIVANLHYKPEHLRVHLEAQGVNCILETPEILETGGGLRNALPALGNDTVFTLNTDAIWRGANPLSMLLDAWDPNKMDALLMGIHPGQAKGHSGAGDFQLGRDGRLTRGPGIIYGGAQIVKAGGLRDIDQSTFSLNLLWNRILQDGRLFGLSYPGEWCDVGSPEGVAIAEAMLKAEDV